MLEEQWLPQYGASMVIDEKFIWKNREVLIGIGEILKVSDQNSDMQCLRTLS